MSSAIYFRVFGHVVGLGLHLSNTAVMHLNMQNQEITKDPEIKTMISMQSRYLTVWNIFFQLLYFSLALLCDGAILTNRDHLIPKRLKNFRQTLFAVFLIPTTFIIFQIFWPIFIYDRSLIFPAFIDKIFSFKSNLVMHLAILPLALWELVFLPRPIPISHSRNLTVLILYIITYDAFVLYTYSQTSLFPYPLLYPAYGTIYLPLLLLGTIFLGIFDYMIQWNITKFVWGSRGNTKKSYKVK